MTLIISKKTSAHQVANVKRKLRKKKNIKTGIARYYGALKRGIDSLAYQNEARKGIGL